MEKKMVKSLKTCNKHTFIHDIRDVKQMEHSLLTILDDFHKGRLQAFGKESSFEKMNNIRDLQEKLGKRHFFLDSEQQQINRFGSEEAKEMSNNLEILLNDLQQLGKAVQELHQNETGR